MNLQERVDALSHTIGSRGWQDVIKPALEAAIDTAVNQLVTGARPAGSEKVTDDQLKERVKSLRWVLGWEANQKLLLDQLEAVTNMLQSAEPATEGGSIYD